MTTPARLDAWVATARDAGRVAFDTETTGLDAMHADLVGFSLARRAGQRLLRAARPPRRRERPVRRRRVLPVSSMPRGALDALKPLLEDPSILKIGQNLKYDRRRARAARHRDRAASTTRMLMSYALDGGTRRARHGRSRPSATSATPASRSTT